MAHHHILRWIFQHGNERRNGCLVAHLPQAVGRLVLKQCAAIAEDSPNGLDGLVAADVFQREECPEALGCGDDSVRGVSGGSG